MADRDRWVCRGDLRQRKGHRENAIPLSRYQLGSRHGKQRPSHGHQVAPAYMSVGKITERAAPYGFRVGSVAAASLIENV
jgi:hypothetical protein